MLLVRRLGGGEVVNVNVAISSPDHSKRVVNVHGVDPLWEGRGVGRGRAPEVPESHRLVPTSRDEKVHRGYVVAVPDWGIVLGHLLRLLRG